jgi:glycosyltransferase involved in cell wall biosynthesis
MKSILKDRDIILISSANYNSINNSKLNVHFIASEFAKLGNKVLFIESLGIKGIPLYGNSDIKKVITRLFDFVRMLIKGPKIEKDNIFIVSLIRIPFDNIPIINTLNQKFITYFIKKYSNRYLKPKPIIWSFVPNFWAVTKQIENSAVIYHNVDDYSAIPFVNKSYVIANERKMLRVSDLVFTVSKGRVEYFKEYTNSDVIFLNNVGNFEQFNKALNDDIEPPRDLIKVLNQNKPIVGFVGNLASYKEDVNLLTEIAMKGKEYLFVIIGGIGEGELLTNILILKTLPNVFFLGSKEYESLYKYLHYFDVAIIPRRKNAAGEGGFPMKYFEYLSAGLPTIVTGVGNMNQFTKIARLGGVANNSYGFLELIQYWITLKQKNNTEYQKAVSERLKLAKLNSWSKRIDQLNSFISKVIK